MSGEPRPVVRIPSIFDSDDDSEEETTHSTMTFRALTTTTTINTTTTTTTTKPITESQQKPSPPAPMETKEPQSLSSNSDSDGEPFSPKPDEAKPIKPIGSPHVQSSSEDSENSEDEGRGKNLVFSKERKLEDEEEEEDEDVTLVADQGDNINISHSSPENQDGSDDEDEDDSSNSDDDDEDDSDDEQDRSGSSVEYESMTLSQEGGSHVVYSPATPLSIKITTIKKGGFAIRQETPSFKPSFQAHGARDKEKHIPEQQEKNLPAAKEKEILKEHEDKITSEEKMELEETKKEEKEAKVAQEDEIEEIKDKKDIEICRKSLPMHEKVMEKNENQEKVNGEEAEEMDNSNKNSSTKTIEEEKNALSEQKKESREREEREEEKIEAMESSQEETIPKETTKHTTSDRSEKSEPIETTVKEYETNITSSRSEVIETKDESDCSDHEALAVESPLSPATEANKEIKDEVNKDKDEPMEVEEEKDLIGKEGVRETHVGEVQKPLEVRDEKEEREEEEMEIEEKEKERGEHTDGKEEKEEEEGKETPYKTTYRNGEEEKEEKEKEEEIEVAQIDPETTYRYRKEEKDKEEVQETTFRREEKEEKEKVQETTFRREEKEEEEKEIQETMYRREEEEKEEKEREIQETTFRREEREEEKKNEEEEEEAQQPQVNNQTTFTRVEKKEGKEEAKEIRKTQVITQTTFRKEEKKTKEDKEKHETEEESDKTNTHTNTRTQEENKDRNYDKEDRLKIIDVEDVEMKERKEEEQEEEAGKRGRGQDSSRARDKSPPPSAIPPPVTVVLNSDSDSETTMDAEKARDIISQSSAKKTKVPLKVEDVYLDSEDDSHSLSKPSGEGGSERGAAGGCEGGGLSTLTSETDSVDPEDQRDCLSQHSSSRASSTDLFSKVSSCSPRPESPSDTPTRSRQSARPKKPFNLTPTELARYMEAFNSGWRREIVMRAIQNPTKAGGARADIYYYAPSGKKLRSKVEIEDYLYRVGITDLTLDNFTWVKQPLGVSEQYEVIRHASAKSAASLIAPPRRKPTPGTPTSTGSTSPAATAQHSSAPPHSTSHTPKATPVVTITTYTKTPPMVRIPASVKAISGIKSPVVSSAPSTTKASVSASSVASAASKGSPGVVYSYDTTTPRKRGRGRPRKYSQEEPQPAPKRARMKTTPIVPVSLKKGAGRGDITSPLPPPPPPPPLPPPPTTIPAALPTSPAMQHLQHHTPPTQGMSMSVQRPILPTPTPRPRQPARKTKDPVVTTGHITSLPPGPPKILTPMLMGGARQRTFHCTGTCPLGGGSVPCLQCVKCLCLFHPECTCMPPQIVTIIQAGAAKFLCPNCYRENKENVGSNKWVLPEPFEPLAHDPSSASSDTESEDETTGGRQSEKEVWVENYTQVCLRPDTPPTPPSSPSPSHSLGPWRGDGSDSRQDQISEQAQQSSQSGEMSRGLAAMACLPPHSMGSQLVQIQQPGSTTPCFFLVQGRPGAPGGELVPMPGAGMGVGKGMQPVILPRFMDQQQQVQMSGPLMMQQQLFRSTMPLQMQQQDLPAPHKQEMPFGKHYKQYYERESSFLGELSQRYLLLRHVFKYLSVRDLLVASQVCMLWRDLALSPSLWETVRLRNVCVTDWSEFARFLDQRNTKNLDLRKMRLKEVDITKRSSKNGGKQKLKVKGSSSNTQEANTSSESLKKSPRDSLIHQDPSTKNARGVNENQELSHRNHHPSNSADDGESSLTRNRPGDIHESLSRKVKEEEMEVDEDKRSDSESNGELYMNCEEEEKHSNSNRGKSSTLKSKETRAGHQEAQWQDIFSALSLVRCLRGVTLPACPGHVLQLLLASCRHLTCINAMDLRHPSGPIRFDPAYLMETADLTELRIGSPSGFSLTTNFNFIKLQKLRVLVMRGLTGDSWPYLGTNLTTLQVGPIKTFTARTWANLGSMTNLQALWLEDGGSLFDSSVCEGLSRLTSLRRLCLFNFVVGPKLGNALKKLPHLDRLFVLPVGTEEASIVSQNGNMLAAVEVLRHVEELVWAVHASDVYFSGGCDCIRMSPNDSKMYKGMQESPDSNLWSLPKLEMVLKRQLPHSNMRIIKLDPTAASHLALATL